MTGPLSHLRAIDFSTGIPGAYCTKLLVDAGVDVIKVEPPGGDPLRTYSASGQEVPLEEGAPLFRYLSAGKRSVIGEPGDPHVHALLADADIVVESFGPGRFDVDGVRSRHPHLVILSISPFGAGGPLSDRVATDFIVQAESGTVLFRGKPSRDPVQAGGRLAEYVGGLYGAPAVVVAAARARRTGIGEHIDLSLAEAMAIAGSVFGDLANHCMGRPEAVGPSRSVETPSIERASDGFVGFNTNTATQFQNFLILIERTDLLDDPRFAGLAGRYGHLEEWQQIIDGYMPHHPVEETVDTAAALRIPVSPVYDGETVLTNEHVVRAWRVPRGCRRTPPSAPALPPRRRSTARAATRAAPRRARRHHRTPHEAGAHRARRRSHRVAARRAQGARRHVVVGRRRRHPLPRVDGRRSDPRRVDHAPRRHAPHGWPVRATRLVGVGPHVRRREHRQARHHHRRGNRCWPRPDGAPDRVGRRAGRELRAARDGELAPRPRRGARDQPEHRVPADARDGSGRPVARPGRVRADDGADERPSVDHRVPRRHPADPPRPRRSHRGAPRRVCDPRGTHATGSNREGRGHRGTR